MKPLKTAIELASPAIVLQPEVTQPESTLARFSELSQARETIAKQAADETARIQRELEQMAEVRRPFDELINARVHLVAAIARGEGHAARLESAQSEMADYLEKGFFAEQIDVGFLARFLVTSHPHWVVAEHLRTQLTKWLFRRRGELLELDEKLRVMARERGLESDLPAELRSTIPNLPDAA